MFFETLWLLILLHVQHSHPQWVSPMLESRNQKAKVQAFDFGIWEYILEDDAYKVTDVIVPSPINHFSTRTDGAWQLFSHESLNTVVSQSKLLMAAANHTTLGFFVNGELAASIEVDDKPSGATTVGAKVAFTGAKHLYGIPERAVDLALKPGSKYRLWNLDVFRYQLEDTKGLYGTIPFLMAHSATRTVGMLWLNAGDTTVSITEFSGGIQASWTSLSGTLDMFLFPGPTPADVLQQMMYLTGKPFLPPLFSLGYHQCRWNYRNEEDTLSVDEGFDTHDIPYDVIWLDIEHTDGKRYFTWDQHHFPNPEQMQEKIAAKGRKMVTITDPHIKRAPGYHVFDEASSKGYFVKNSAGTGDFEGHCWPGTSSWLDFSNPEVRNWYATLFLYDRYKGSTPILYTWIDMNEPSVFNSHEVTMDIEAQHHGNVQHKDLHNQYGHYQMMATHAGQLLRSQGPPHDTPTRPFLLSRSFFAGSQRYGAVWTGDNEAKWSHLAKATPMLLTMSLSGLPFVGADVGGFFDNPEDELLVRWYQAAAYTPFYRGHAHLETKRREPWLFGEQNTQLIRDAIRSRYRILPYLYTAFYKASQEGLSVISPLFFWWPADEQTFALQTQFMLGDAIMVRPITSPISENKGVADVYLPGDPSERWYDFADGTPFAAAATITVACDLQKIPVFQRPGTIVPMRQRARRSTTAMRNDPFTLQIALDAQGSAAGALYLDDSHSFKYERGAFIHRQFEFRAGRLTSTPYARQGPYTTPSPTPAEQFISNVYIERIRVFGLRKGPQAIYLEFGRVSQGSPSLGMQEVTAGSVQGRQELTFTFADGVLTIRKPAVALQHDWNISFA